MKRHKELSEKRKTGQKSIWEKGSKSSKARGMEKAERGETSEAGGRVQEERREQGGNGEGSARIDEERRTEDEELEHKGDSDAHEARGKPPGGRGKREREGKHAKRSAAAAVREGEIVQREKIKTTKMRMRLEVRETGG